MRKNLDRLSDLIKRRQSTATSTLQSLQDSMAAAVGKADVQIGTGSFLVRIDPNSDRPWQNFAVPTNGPATREDIEELLEIFKRFGKRPRIELMEGLDPKLEAILPESGMAVDVRLPVLSCTKSAFVPHFRAGDAVLLDEADDPIPYMSVGSIAFGEAQLTDPERVTRWRDSIRNGDVLCVQASDADQIASVGCAVMGSPCVEIAGVGTLPEHRRKGLAALVVSRLVQEVWNRSPEAIVWLSAADEKALGVYKRLGFKTVGYQVNYLGALP